MNIHDPVISGSVPEPTEKPARSERWDYKMMDNYPVLFQDRNDRGKSLMYFGACCDDGWRKIVEDLTEAIAKVDTQHIVRVFQIKEKFGTLRYYVNFDTKNEGLWKTVNDLVSSAEKLTATTCEICGQPGILCVKKDGYWYKTVCSSCAKKEGYENIPKNKMMSCTHLQV